MRRRFHIMRVGKTYPHYAETDSEGRNRGRTAGCFRGAGIRAGAAEEGADAREKRLEAEVLDGDRQVDEVVET